MIGIPRVDLEIDNLAYDVAKKLNLNKMPAILGDQPPGSTTPAQLYDPTILGNVWVLEVTSNGYSTRKSVRGPTSSTVPMRAGKPVFLKYDIDGKLAIDKIDFAAEQSAGNNPIATNASDAQANAFVSTSSITTLLSTPTAPPSLNVSLFGWKPVENKIIYDFPGALVDLSSFVPAAGNHCFAVIFVKSDFATVEVFASTAKSTSDPLTITGDLQEAISQGSSGSTAVWGWRLHDAQTSIVDADRLIDLRNPWNTATNHLTLPVNVTVRVVTAAGAVTVTTSDYVVVVNKTVGAATTVNLPASPATGDTYVIKDGKGDAGANNITLTPAAGNIDGAGTKVMATNYQSISLVYNGTEWNVV